MQRLLIVSMIVVLVATPLRGDSDENLLYGSCKMDCGGIARTIPSTFCSRMACFKAANTKCVPLKNKLRTRNAILLYGPPGAGKSTLAEIFAKETIGVRPVTINASSLVTVEQGSGASNIRAVFEVAKNSKAPTVIVIEEVDNIADVSGSPLNKNEDRKSAYQELNCQLDSIAGKYNIFVICTTNYPEKCASEFLSRFDRVKIERLSENEKISAIRYLFFNNEGMSIDVEEVCALLGKLAQKNHSGLEQDVKELVLHILEVESLFKKLSLNHCDEVEQSKICDHTNKFKEMVVLFERQYAQIPGCIEREIDALKFVTTIWELKRNTYSLITKPNAIFDELLQQSTGKSLRFIKCLADDVLLHAQLYHEAQISKKLVECRAAFAKQLLEKHPDNPKAAYEEWQQEMLLNQQNASSTQWYGMIAQNTIAFGGVAVQGAAHGKEIAASASAIKAVALAHPVALGVALGAGAVYGSYKFYKWIMRADKVAKQPEQPRQDDKPHN